MQAVCVVLLQGLVAPSCDEQGSRSLLLLPQQAAPRGGGGGTRAALQQPHGMSLEGEGEGEGAEGCRLHRTARWPGPRWHPPSDPTVSGYPPVSASSLGPAATLSVGCTILTRPRDEPTCGNTDCTYDALRLNIGIAGTVPTYTRPPAELDPQPQESANSSAATICGHPPSGGYCAIFVMAACRRQS